MDRRAAGDTGLPLAGEGAPLVAEFCIAEFALAIGRSTDAGTAADRGGSRSEVPAAPLLGRVQSGDLEAWRARRIAEATFGLSMEAAAFVDAQVAPFAHRIGIAALERLVAEAIARFMPDQAAEDARSAADGRHFTIEHQQVPFDGTSQIRRRGFDLADALDLDAAADPGCRDPEGAGVDRVTRRPPIHRRRPDRPQQPRPRPHTTSAQEATTASMAGDRSRVRWSCTCTSPRPPIIGTGDCLE